MLDFIARPLGQILYFIYNTIAFRNYGFSIIVFTILVKLILLPLTLKQYNSTAKIQALQPQIQEIQKKYDKDKEKLNLELTKVYQENKVNPAGGCFPLLIQMPILASLYWVITGPLKFMLNKSSAQISQLASMIQGVSKNGSSLQIDILGYFSQHRSELYGWGNLLKPDELINMNFLGLNLGIKPSFAINDLFGANWGTYLPLLIIPILAVLTTYISTKLAAPKAAQKSATTGTDNLIQNLSMYIGPAVTFIFSFQLPAGVILYWIAGYIFQIIQQLYINKFVINNASAAVR